MRKVFSDLKELVTQLEQADGEIARAEIEEKLSGLKGQTALKFPARC